MSAVGTSTDILEQKSFTVDYKQNFTTGIETDYAYSEVHKTPISYLSVLFFCSCAYVYHKQEVRFL